ncbi:tripartite motif-containing protein 45, partial [Elysia marginata]
SLANDLRQAITDKEQELLERLHSVASQLQEKLGDFRGIPSSKEDDRRTLRSAHARMEALMKYGSDVEVLEMYQAVQAPLSRLEGADTDTAAAGEDEVHLSVEFKPDDLVQVFRRELQALGEISVQDSSSDAGLAAWGVAVTEKDDIIVVDCR